MDAHPIPSRFTPHEVIVKALAGQGAYGSTFAAPVTVPAFVVEEQRMVLDATGAEVLSSTQVHVAFDVTAPPGSLVTVWPGTTGVREGVVISSVRAAHPRLPAFQTLSLT